MAEKFIYDHTGTVTRVVHADKGAKFGDDFAIETVEDCEPIVEEAKVLAENHAERGDMKHVARIPVTVVEQALREGWFHDENAWKKWLNDPDNKDFRVWKGRV